MAATKKDEEHWTFAANNLLDFWMIQQDFDVYRFELIR